MRTKLIRVIEYLSKGFCSQNRNGEQPEVVSVVENMSKIHQLISKMV